MEAFLQSKSVSIIEKYKVRLPEDTKEAQLVSEKVAFYVYNLVFNVCALIATVASIHDPEKKKVKPRHILSSLTYVQNQCFPQLKSMKGGSYHVDGEYFGKESHLYQDSQTHHVTDQINFQDYIARNELPSSFAGGAVQTIFTEFAIVVSKESPKRQMFPSSYIREIFTSFGVSIKENSLDIVKQILKMHLNCFMYDLHERGKVTLKKLEEVAHLSRHAVFL